MAGGRLTRWFEERIREVKRGHPRGGHQALGACNPTGTDAAGLMELEGLRDEARRLEEGGGAPACLAKVREALRRDSKPWMRGALREVIDELGGGE